MNKLNNIFNQFITHTFVSRRFFYVWTYIVVIYILSFRFHFLFLVAHFHLLIMLLLTIIDYILVQFFENQIQCTRNAPQVLPLGDEQNISLIIKNNYSMLAYIEIIEELPIEFQKRDFSFRFILHANEERTITYNVRPLTRGAYQFGNCNIFVSTILGLIQHKMVFPLKETIPVYPSSVQVKKHELLLFNKLHSFQGVKKMRKIGHSYEFEQIKNYTDGDDIRSINWKATGRQNQLMTNQFGDEKSQQVYSILDKSRAMNMPFNGLSLLDYAVNSTLVISNTALHKDDKVGILTFNEKMGSFAKADKKPGQLKRISEILHKEEESNFEANFELLYHAITRLIKQRSLLILYTNFESYYTLERYLPILRRLNYSHLLLVVIFKNTEIEKYSFEAAEDALEIYHKTIGKKFLSEKDMMVKELTKFGISSILTAPQDLSTQTINKYLEFKAKGWI